MVNEKALQGQPQLAMLVFSKTRESHIRRSLNCNLLTKQTLSRAHTSLETSTQTRNSGKVAKRELTNSSRNLNSNDHGETFPVYVLIGAIIVQQSRHHDPIYSLVKYSRTLSLTFMNFIYFVAYFI